ncbi:GNAT family N-acetyltransferase [Paenibacillus humicus]|uniref:GNAT family N-acetyltransferase n=1 Tax=Paenibacillus humicus TaxID=412861 RepID=UPI000FD89BBC|nr:GNAT family N-acetyltransferase [Paenibacillus humicus]
MRSIKRLMRGEPLPLELLLLADPARDLVEEYAGRGECWVLEDEEAHAAIGVYVLIRTRPATAELVNVAVSESHQGRGIGKKLVLHAVERAREIGMATIEVGTGSTGIGQIALYQKCGFRITGVDRDFFIRHYEEEIIENGMILRDMLRFSMDL